MPKVTSRCPCGKGKKAEADYCYYCKDEAGFKERKKDKERERQWKEREEEATRAFYAFLETWSGGTLELDHHYNLHSKGFTPSNHTRTLDCPICSGLPPWEWGYWKPHTMYVAPRNEKYRCLDREEGKYCFRYIAFGWRSERRWWKPVGFMDECRICGRFARCARHDIRNGRKTSSICLKCVRKENRAQATADQEGEVNRLLSQLRKGLKQ